MVGHLAITYKSIAFLYRNTKLHSAYGIKDSNKTLPTTHHSSIALNKKEHIVKVVSQSHKRDTSWAKNVGINRVGRTGS